jgi:hypothetical protein
MQKRVSSKGDERLLVEDVDAMDGDDATMKNGVVSFVVATVEFAFQPCV